MEIIFQAHNAVISDQMRARSERAVRKMGVRLRRTVDAVIRFEQDGPVRRVEVVLNAPGRRPLVAEGTAHTFGPALSSAVGRIERQLGRHKRSSRALRSGPVPVRA
ncbi:MAG TPA: HPF/RaiA family ribosome-associated protein [Gemmatimonadaceae bacterium]|nr:HPF/RaiA family ribosome-associated protein [Gemmatimonadaceae bacterium]